MTELPFGRGKHHPLFLVPCGYLRWFIRTVHMDDEELRRAIEQRLDEHEAQKRRTNVEAVAFVMEELGAMLRRKEQP